VRALALAIACDVSPLNNSGVLEYLRGPLRADDGAVNAWYAHWIARGLKALEQNVHQTSADGRHMYGTAPTLADVCLVPQMYNARRYHCDLAPYPTLRAICAHLEALPAFAQAAPQAQPEA
jgi:maleylacetoacetate isomerase